MARNQTGFITLPLAAWGAIAAAVVIGGLLLALKVQSSRLEAVKQEYAAFQAQVKANGDAAAKEAKRIEAENKAKKDKIDNENIKLRADVAALNRKLRDKHPAGSGLPEAPANSSRPELACFDRAAFRGAYGALVTELRTIADQCSADAVDLNSARAWAADIRR